MSTAQPKIRNLKVRAAVDHALQIALEEDVPIIFASPQDGGVCFGGTPKITPNQMVEISRRLYSLAEDFVKKFEDLLGSPQ